MTIICPDYKLGTTLIGLTRLPALGIPDPWNAPYNPFSVRNQSGDGLIQGQGFPFTTWQWPSLSYAQAANLMRFISTDMASVKLYLRTRLPSGVFANFYGVLVRPVLDGTDGAPSDQQQDVFTEFSARWIHLVAL